MIIITVTLLSKLTILVLRCLLKRTENVASTFRSEVNSGQTFIDHVQCFIITMTLDVSIYESLISNGISFDSKVAHLIEEILSHTDASQLNACLNETSVDDQAGHNVVFLHVFKNVHGFVKITRL